MATGSNPTSAQAATPPTAVPLGLTPPVGPPDDPFVDASRRGYLMQSGWRWIPTVNTTYVRDTNPLMLDPSSGTDGISAVNLALTVKSATPELFSGFFVIGAVHHDALQEQREKPALAQLLYNPKIDGWTIPLSYVYSRNTLSRTSLLSEQSNIPPVRAQETTLNQITADAIRQFGSTGVSLGMTWADVQVGSALLLNGESITSSASNTTLTGRVRLSRPAFATSQWFVRGQVDEYTYGAGSQAVLGSPRSTVWTGAAGLQGILPSDWRYIAEIGSARKTSTSSLVPGSTSTIGALNFMWTPNSGTQATVGVNRSVFETNLPTLSNAVATSYSLTFNQRLNAWFILQANGSFSHIEAVPIAGSMDDSSAGLTLLWKPRPSLLFGFSVSGTSRRVSSEVAAFGLNPFHERKYLVNMTWYP